MIPVRAMLMVLHFCKPLRERKRETHTHTHTHTHSRRSGITQAAPGSPWQSADGTGTSIRADNASQGGGIELIFWGRFLPSHWRWALATTPLQRHAQTRVNTHHATLGAASRPLQMRGTHSAGMYDLQETAQNGRRVLQTRASRSKPRGS